MDGVAERIGSLVDATVSKHGHDGKDVGVRRRRRYLAYVLTVLAAIFFICALGAAVAWFFYPHLINRFPTMMMGGNEEGVARAIVGVTNPLAKQIVQLQEQAKNLSAELARTQNQVVDLKNLVKKYQEEEKKPGQGSAPFNIEEFERYLNEYEYHPPAPATPAPQAKPMS